MSPGSVDPPIILESNVMKEKEVVDPPRLFLASPSDSGYFGEK